ncbi:MAG: hypothetical protein U0263_34665 [Polyangiaceae bacterium]
MCCFSAVQAGSTLWERLRGVFGPPLAVSDTAIFARRVDPRCQALIYSMRIRLRGETAMLLPIPVVPGSGDDALEFVSLVDHAGFFDSLRSLFFVPMTAAARGGGYSLPHRAPKLVVHEVGSFEASFVPTQADFSRLDERFRLPESIWEELGDYDDYGFAVFRLRPGRKKPIHPMAFRFVTREPGRLFFPTVHVHDGRVHDHAEFDHELYYQTPAVTGAVGSFRDPATGDEIGFSRPPDGVLGLVEPGEPVLRRVLRGTLPNRDTWIELGAASALEH